MKRPDMMVLQELIDDMYEMDSEEVLKKRKRGPTITIAIGESAPMKGNEEMEKEEPEEMGESVPVDSPISGLEMEDEDDGEEDMLCEEARSLGIPDPESMDMRLLKKLIAKKKMA